MSKLAPYFEDRETRLNALGPKTRARLDEMMQGAEDPDQVADQFFVSAFLSERTGKRQSDILSNYEAERNAYFRKDISDSEAWNQASEFFRQSNVPRNQQNDFIDAGKTLMGGTVDTALMMAQGSSHQAAILSAGLDGAHLNQENARRVDEVKARMRILSQEPGQPFIGPAIDPEYTMINWRYMSESDRKEFLALNDELKGLQHLAREDIKAKAADSMFMDWSNQVGEHRKTFEAWNKIDQEFRDSLVGQVVSAVGQLGVYIPTAMIPYLGPIALESSLYQEGLDDYRNSVPVEEQNELEGSSYALKYALPAVILEKVGLKGITKNLFRGKTGLIPRAELARRAAAAAGEGFVSEGVTEALQGQLLDFIAAEGYDQDRDPISKEAFRRRFTEFLVGGFAGGGSAGVLSSADTVVTNRRNKGLVQSKVGGPLTGAEFKQAREFLTDADVLRRFKGNNDHAELFIQAMNGSKEHQILYNALLSPDKIPGLQKIDSVDKATLYADGTDRWIVNRQGPGAVMVSHVDVSTPLGKEFMEKWNIRRRELERSERGQFDLLSEWQQARINQEIFGVEALPTVIERQGEWIVLDPGDEVIGKAGTEEEAKAQALLWTHSKELREARAMNREAITFLEGVLDGSHELRQVESDLTMRDAINQGLYTFDEIRGWLRSQLNDPEYEPSLDDLQNLVINGRNVVEGQGKHVRDISFIYDGGHPDTVIEEASEGYFKRAIDENDISLDQALEWKHAWEEVTGKIEYADDLVGVTEMFSDMAVGYVHSDGGIVQDISDSSLLRQLLPTWFETWVRKLTAYYQYVVRHAANMVRLREAGELTGDLETHIRRSIGLDEDYREERFREIERQEAEAERLDPGKDLQEVLKGRIAHPEALREAGEPLAAEVAGLYDNLVREVNVRRRARPGDKTSAIVSTTRQKNYSRANAYFPKSGGTNLDRIRESLAEDGFVFDTVDEMLQALDDTMRGNIVYPSFQYERVIERAEKRLEALRPQSIIGKDSGQARTIGEIDALIDRGILSRDRAINQVGQYIHRWNMWYNRTRYPQPMGKLRQLYMETGISSPAQINRILDEVEKFNAGGKWSLRLPVATSFFDSAQLYGKKGLPSFQVQKFEDVSTGYRDRLRDLLDEKVTGKSVRIDQVISMIQKGGLKQEEIQWSGILPWLESLKEHGDSVSKEDLLLYMDSEGSLIFMTRYLGRQTPEEYEKLLHDLGYFRERAKEAKELYEEKVQEINQDSLYQHLSERVREIKDRFNEDMPVDAYRSLSEVLNDYQVKKRNRFDALMGKAQQDAEYYAKKVWQYERAVKGVDTAPGHSRETLYHDYRTPGGTFYEERIFEVDFPPWLRTLRIKDSERLFTQDILRDWDKNGLERVKFGEASLSFDEDWIFQAFKKTLIDGRILESRELGVPLSRELAEKWFRRRWKYHTAHHAKELWDFKEHHWRGMDNQEADFGDYTAHTRTAEFVAVEAGRGVLIEELQSDLHQAGRKHGYQNIFEPAYPSNLSSAKFADQDRNALTGYKEELRKAMETDLETLSGYELKQAIKHRLHTIGMISNLEASIRNRTHFLGKMAPMRPFVKDWPVQLFKRVLVDALQEQADVSWIGWTSGYAQVQRYPGLSSRLLDLKVKYSDLTDSYHMTGVYAHNTNQAAALKIARDQISANFSRPVAEKILAITEKTKEPVSFDLKGDDQIVGGWGMLRFYDEMLPKMLGKFLKPLGGTIEKGNLVIPEDSDQKLSEFWMVQITPEMRRKVLAGMPSFQIDRRPDPHPPEDYGITPADELAAEYASRQNALAAEQEREAEKKAAAEDRLPLTKNRGFVSYLGLPISSSIRRISPSVFSRVRRYALELNMEVQEFTERTLPFRKAFKRLNKVDRAKVGLYLSNGEYDRAAALMGDNDNGLAELQKLFEDLRRMAVKAGYEVGFVADYFPRWVIDVDGLLSTFGQEVEGKIQEQLRLAEERHGVLTEEEKIVIVNNMLRGIQTVTTPNKPPNFKERGIDQLEQAQYDEFYASPFEALDRYIKTVLEGIHARQFFGTKIVYDRISTGETDKFGEEVSKVVKRRIDLEKSIGAYLLPELEAGRINYREQRQLQNDLQAFFGYQITPKRWAAFRTLGYVTTMGSGITSTITQIQDIAFAANESGFNRAWTSYLAAVFGLSEVKIEKDLGLGFLNNEYKDMISTARILDTVFTITGLKHFGRAGQNTLVNAGIRKYRALARRGKLPARERERLLEYFGGNQLEVNMLMQELRANETTDRIRLLGWNILADYHPVDLSEMPRGYLENPKARVFYMLKTFTIKQLDSYRREGIAEMHRGLANKDWRRFSRGFKNLVKLMAMLWLAGVPVDWLKDWLMNRDPEWSNVAVDNVYKLVGLTRYSLYYAREHGIRDTVLITLAPPVPYFDYPARDLQKAFGQNQDWSLDQAETWRVVPLIGSPYYWRYGGGQEKIERRRERERKKRQKADAL